MGTILARIARGDRVEHFETIRMAKDGRLIPVSLSVSPVKNAAGRVIGAAKIARDITERRRAEAERERLLQEARQAVEVRDTFLSVAGHEFRTPLNALSLQLYNLEMKLTDPVHRAAVVRSQKQVTRLADLTHQLLDVARMASGSFSLETATMDLADLARDVVARMSESVGSPIRLRVDGPVLGDWDRARLDQVVTNLVQNALKFGDGGPVEVAVETVPGRARLIVRDHGIGVDPSDRERIFERFERAAPEQSFGGLGLGLWIARQIIEAHGGRIGVESPEDGGTRFFVELGLKGGEGADSARG